MIAKTSYIALTILRTTRTSTSLSGTTSLAEFMKIGPVQVCAEEMSRFSKVSQ